MENNALRQKIEAIREEIKTKAEKLDSSKLVYELRKSFMDNKTGKISALMKEMKNIPAEDRAEYVQWYNEKGQRKWIIDNLVEQHPEYNFTYGGQISVDIVKKGCDKAQVVNYYKDKYKITYFGDRIYKRGNDNSIAHEVVDCGGSIYSVSGPAETMHIMQRLIEEDKKTD